MKKILLLSLFCLSSHAIESSASNDLMDAEIAEHNELYRWLTSHDMTVEEIKEKAESLNLDARNSSKESVLLILAFQGLDEKIKMLVEAGANKNFKTDLGTAFHYAISSNKEESLQIKTLKSLIDLGVDINETNKDGQTPVNLAREFGKPEIVTVLREYKKADVSLPVKIEKTSSEVARATNGEVEQEKKGFISISRLKRFFGIFYVDKTSIKARSSDGKKNYYGLNLSIGIDNSKRIESKDGVIESSTSSKSSITKTTATRKCIESVEFTETKKE